MQLGAAITTLAWMTASVLPTPGDLIASTRGPESFERVERQVGLSFDEYAQLEPDAVAHLDRGDDAAADMLAAVDIWTSPDDDIVLRQITQWGDEASAVAYVDQIVAIAEDEGLQRTSAPISEANSFIGVDADGVHTQQLILQHDTMVFSVERFSVDVRSQDIVFRQGGAFIAAISRAFGTTPSTTEAAAGTAAAPATGGGIPIWKVGLWLAIIIGAIWLFVKVRRKIRGATATKPSARADGSTAPAGDEANDPKSVDEMIERARARSRAEREVEAASGPELGEDWKIPDEY